jgi:hypothetical protein
MRNLWCLEKISILPLVIYYTRLFKYPPKKSSGLRSGDLVGHAKVPRLSINF